MLTLPIPFNMELATFGQDDVYNQKDAEGFINLFGLPLKVQALCGKREGCIIMKLWGKVGKGTSQDVDEFHSSIHFDYRLYRQDILAA